MCLKFLDVADTKAALESMWYRYVIKCHKSELI